MRRSIFKPIGCLVLIMTSVVSVFYLGVVRPNIEVENMLKRLENFEKYPELLVNIDLTLADIFNSPDHSRSINEVHYVSLENLDWLGLTDSPPERGALKGRIFSITFSGGHFKQSVLRYERTDNGALLWLVIGGKESLVAEQ
jgi:hypothetical protein